MFIASDTDIGKKRSENQDRVHAEFLADNVAVAVVCDGMGGASSGGVASQLAIDAVVKRIKENFRKDMKPNSIRNLMLIRSCMARARRILTKTVWVLPALRHWWWIRPSIW